MNEKVELAANTEMDAVSLELKKYLYNLPFRYQCKHDNIVQIRRELRVMVMSMLVGDNPQILFGNEPVAKRVFLSPQQWNPTQRKTNSHTHNGRPCARKLERGEATHRCLTCGVDDTCVLCVFCFNPADHVGHNVFVKVSSRDDGGICDCGDNEAWNRELHCSSDEGPEETQELPAEFVENASKVLNVLFDYVVDVLSSSSMDTQTSDNAVELSELAKRSELNPHIYGVQWTDDLFIEQERLGGGKWCLNVWDDDRRSLSDLYTTLQLATSRGTDYLQVILDHVQIGGRGTVALSSSLEEMITLKRKIRNFSTSIRLLRDIIREEIALEIVKISIDMCHCRLVGYEPTSFMNIVGSALLRPWNAGVEPWNRANTSDDTPSTDHYADAYQSSNLQGYNIPISQLNLEIPQLEFSSSGLEFDGERDEDLQRSAEELFGPDNVMGIYAIKLGNTLRRFMPNLRFKWPLENMNSRVKYLIFFDIRLPKMMRQELTDLYLASLVSNMELKMQMATIYADVYPLLIDHYCKIDRDPECSVTTSLSTQLFTTPSIATKLMQSDAFGVYMNRICSQYTKNDQLNPPAFKNRRLGQIFHEFRNLLWRNNEKQLVGANPARIIQTAYFLSMFQGLAPLVRKIDMHVKFEGEKWISCFAIMPLIIQLSRGVAIGIDEGFKNNLPNASEGMMCVARALYLWQSNLHELLAKNSQQNLRGKLIPPPNPIWHHDTGEALMWMTSKTKIWSDPVSMLNPVHWFLSLLIQFSKINDRRRLLEILDIRETDSSLFDANMCTVALLSHISVGLWVRNGLSLRIQLQCYRDTTLRDLAYAQDIHMIQVALCILNPSVVFTNLAYHFALLEWEFYALGDDQQTFYILNEFLQCLTLLLCDRLKFQNLDADVLTKEMLRKEIIHMLGFQTMQYSELIKLVPESMAIDEHFDTVLSETAEFHPPPNENSMGKYSLKKEFYPLFDPYFTHFTIAQTEIAVKAAQAKLGPTHLPQLTRLSGAWARLGMFTKSVAFANFITRLVHHVVRNIKPLDTLERVLHLLLMAALDDAQAHRDLYGTNAPTNLSESEKTRLRDEFLNSSVYIHEETCFRSVGKMALERQRDPGRPVEFRESTLVDLLLRAAVMPQIISLRPQIKLLLDLMREVEPEIPILDIEALDKTNNVADTRAQLKERAKMMQEKVMADFMRQQQEFMNKNEEATMEDNMMHSDEDFNDDAYEDDDDQWDSENTSNGYVFPKQCVFCRMPDNDGSVFGILTYTCKLDMLRNLPQKDPYWVKQAYGEDPSLDVAHPHSESLPDLGLAHYDNEESCNIEHQPNVSWGYSFPKEEIRETTLVQGCGHGLHYKCYLGVLKQHQQQRLSSPVGSSQSDNELLCPLCRGLNNSFIPILWNKNTLDVSEFLQESSDPVKEMRVASTLIASQLAPQISSSVSSPASSLNESPIEQASHNVASSSVSAESSHVQTHIENIVQDSFKFVSPKFMDMLENHDSSITQHGQLHSILFQQLNWIRQNTPSNQCANLRPLCRAMACCIVHIDVFLRGQTYSTPFGGIFLSQLSGQVVQFLRVFGMYMRTLTGFVLSHLNSSGVPVLEQFDDVNLVPNQSFTRAVEMLYFGAKLKGINEKTIVRQMFVMEIDRVITISPNLDTSLLDLDKVPRISDDAVRTTILTMTDMNTDLIYHLIRHQVTLTARRLALIVFSLCGKYDPDDYVGMMHLPEHDRLLAYLEMPSLDNILKSIVTQNTPECVAHQANLERRSSNDLNVDFKYTFIDYPGVYRLIRLPNRLDSMFSVNGPKLPAEPAICLLCGHLCAIQDSGFREQGPCNAHMATCGVTQGIFLLPRRNALLLLISNGRGTFIPAPYLDLHGEPDEMMRRGRPHYLQPKRYDLFIRDTWLRNAIPSLVMRRLDQSQDAGGWETL